MSREVLADYTHKAWSGWMRYLFSKCRKFPGHTHELEIAVIPGWAVNRWKRQMSTPYSDLPDEEKESNREEADKILALMDKALLCECTVDMVCQACINRARSAPPQPAIHDVTGCEGCWLHCWTGADEAFCPINDRPLGDALYESSAPDWCPLRTAPLLVRLAGPQCTCGNEKGHTPNCDLVASAAKEQR